MTFCEVDDEFSIAKFDKHQHRETYVAMLYYQPWKQFHHSPTSAISFLRTNTTRLDKKNSSARCSLKAKKKHQQRDTCYKRSIVA